jgi:hypothetical protein
MAIPVTNHLDFQQSAEIQNVLFEKRTSAPSSPVLAQFWLITTSGSESIYWRDNSANVKVPRLDKGETVTGTWAFNPASGAPFSTTSTVRVDNLNAHYLADSGGTGRSADTGAVANTIALRDGTGKLVCADPVSGTDVVNYQSMTAYVAGVRDPKESVLYATTAALPSYTVIGNTLTASANGALTVDGSSPALNDRVLIKNETGANQKYNGLYYYAQVGDGSNPWKFTRTTDADQDFEFTNGLYVWVTGGTNHAQSGWLVTTADPITLNTTAITFTQINGATQLLQGNGIDITGNTISVKISGSTTYTATRVLFANSTTTIDSSANLTFVSPALTIGVAGSATGQLKLTGSTSGTVTISPNATAGTWTLELPANGGTANYALVTNGSGVASWSQVSLTAGVTGTLPIANGGTNATSYGANRIIFMNSGNTAFSSDANLTWSGGNLLTIGGGITLTGAQTIQTSTGNLTLTTAAGNGNVQVNAHGTGDFIVFTNQLFVDQSAGNVGIGTTGPGTKLSVYDSSATGGDVVTINSGADNAGEYTGLKILSNVSTVSTSLRNTVGAAGAGRLGIWLKDNGSYTTDTERVSILSSGNVGIGTTGPNTTLDVNGVINAATGYRIANAAGSGKLLRGDGTNFVASTITIPNSFAANDLLFASASNVIGAVTSTASRVLVTNGSGVPSWTLTMPAGLLASDSNSIAKIKFFDVGDGSSTNITLTHNFASFDVAVQVWKNSGDRDTGVFQMVRPTNNTVRIEFLTAPASNAYRAAVWAGA